MGKKGQTFVVGIKLATASREVLTWTLMKVARPGDSVIALHVVTSPTSVSSRGIRAADNQLASSIDGMIGVYETFCSLKRVGLEVKISRGPVRKVLLEETKLSRASKLILGTSKSNALVSPISLAKYCAQRLPNNSSVLVVDHGKVVFQKDGVASASEITSVSKVAHESVFFQYSSDTTPSSSVDLDSIAQDSCVHDTESDHGECTVSPVSVLNDNKHKEDEKEGPQFENQTDGAETGLSSTVFFQMLESDAKITTRGGEARRSFEEPDCTDRLSPSPLLLCEATSSGWPLLHRVISVDKALSPRRQAREMSVVEWALRLPERRTQDNGEAPPRPEGTKDTSVKSGEFENSNRSTLREIMHKDNDGPEEKNHSLTEKLKHICKPTNCKQFSYKDLQSATNSFSPVNLIGKGGCSRVYKGILPSGQSVAVKFLNYFLGAEQELLLEVEIMLALQHKNIVSLIGYCIHGQERLLVYNFVPRGNLEEILHADKGKVVVPWKERLKVAIGVAKALDYLHNKYPCSIIHRDVKSSNILLSEDFEPQLSDFGLAKWAPISSSCIICNDVVGTFGYLAPEYFMYGKVNEKTDVYSFGVVLLELITGKKPISTTDPNHQESLVAWARPLLEDGSMRDLVDSNLGNAYNEGEMQRMIFSAALCIRQAPRFRPRMFRILRLLQGEGDDLICWARHQLRMSLCIHTADEEDEQSYVSPDIQTHLSLAMFGVHDDYDSADGTDHSSIHHLNGCESLEDYLAGRFSRSSSFV